MNMHSFAFVASFCASIGLLTSFIQMSALRRVGRRYERELFLFMIWLIVLVLDLIMTFTVFAH